MPVPRPRTPASNRSNGPAGDTEIPPTTKPVSCSPAPPDARREPIDQAGDHAQLRIAPKVPETSVKAPQSCCVGCYLQSLEGWTSLVMVPEEKSKFTTAL